MKIRRWRLIVLSVAALTGLVACGGSGRSPAPIELTYVSDATRDAIGNYVTEQLDVEVWGNSFRPSRLRCYELYSQRYCYVDPFASDYVVTWANESNETSGRTCGNIEYDDFQTTDFRFTWHVGDESYCTGWFIWDPGWSNGTIPLSMGDNALRITAQDADLDPIRIESMVFIITRVEDVTVPTVLSHSVQERSFSLSFSEPVNPATVNANTVQMLNMVTQQLVPLSLPDYTNGGSQESIRSASVPLPDGLNPDTAYTVQVSGVSDRADQLMTEIYQWTFRPT